jgi:hypothetical protein
MDLSGLTLIIPDTEDVERDAVASAWGSQSGSVLRLGRFWNPPSGLDPQTVKLYGNDSFCLVLAQKIGLALVSPPDDLMGHLDRKWTRRDVTIRTLGEMRAVDFPAFIKPVVPKQFTARVYVRLADLEMECRGLEGSTAVIRSSVIALEAEARSFVLDGRVLDSSIYEGGGEMEGARRFTEEFCRSVPLPKTCVVDAGFIKEEGWAFIEANSSWGAGLNGCEAAKILPAIIAATGPAK